MPHDWRKPNDFLTLLIGDTHRDRVVFLAHGALDGERDNMVCVLKLVTNLLKGNRFGVEVKGLTKGREKLAEALATFISVNNTLVTMVVLGQYKQVH